MLSTMHVKRSWDGDWGLKRGVEINDACSHINVTFSKRKINIKDFLDLEYRIVKIDTYNPYSKNTQESLPRFS